MLGSSINNEEKCVRKSSGRAGNSIEATVETRNQRNENNQECQVFGKGMWGWRGIELKVVWIYSGENLIHHIRKAEAVNFWRIMYSSFVNWHYISEKTGRNPFINQLELKYLFQI